MDIGSIASSSSRLLDALERMGLSQGEGLVSSGPSPVPKELTRLFEGLMEQDQTGLTAQTGETFRQPRADGPSSVAQEDHGFRAEAPDALQGSEVSSIPEADASLLSPSELYHLQFQVAMLRLQADTGSQVNQKAAQGLDSLLRNQS